MFIIYRNMSFPLVQVMDFVSRYLPAYHAYLPTLYKDGPNGSDPDHLLVTDIDEERNPRRNRSDLTAREFSRSSFLSSHRYEHRTHSPSPRRHHHRRRCGLHPSRRRPPPQSPVLAVLLAPSFSLTIGSRRPHSPSCSRPSDPARPAEALSAPPPSSSPSPSPSPSHVLSARLSCAQAAGHHQDPPQRSLLHSQPAPVAPPSLQREQLPCSLQREPFPCSKRHPSYSD
jgi:hypothetical protein